MDLSFRETNSGVGNYYCFDKGMPEHKVDQHRASISAAGVLPSDGTVGEGAVDTNVRRAKCVFIESARFGEIYSCVRELVEAANRSCFKFDITDMAERIQYTEYHETDRGFYDWHVDMTPAKSRRKLTIVVQLSDPSEYDGGELQVRTGMLEPVTIGKNKGLAVVCPTFLLHRVTPVTRGVRRSLVAWIDGPPFR